MSALGNRVTQVFDAAGRRTALVDARSSRYTFVWDAADRQVRQLDPLSRIQTTSYDVASQPILRIDARRNRVTQAFDSDGRLIKRLYPDGTRVTMEYDPVGNWLVLADSTGRYTTSYDALNRDHVVVNPAGKTQTLTYGGASRRRTLVDPEGGTFTYGYDLADRCISLVNAEGDRTSWTFDGEGRNAVQLLANGIRVSMGYDASDRLLRLAHLTSTGTTITSFRDTWDAANNRTARIEADGTLVTWSYDNTYQLTREKRDGTNAYDTTYVYDPARNRLRKVDSGVTTTYSYDVANQLSKYLDSTGTTTFTFDANGNQRTQQVPTGGITTNTWDFENRLIKLALPTGVLNTFSYNGDGQRVEVQDSSGTLKQIWDGQKILEETDENNVVQVVYTLSPGFYGDLASQRRSGATNYYLFDPLGSTVRLTSSSQGLTDSYLYKAFGEILLSGTTANPFRFVGRLGYYLDADFAGYHARARELIALIARWLSVDPLWVVGDLDAYGYVGNRLVGVADPAGTAPSGDISVTVTLPPLPGSIKLSIDIEDCVVDACGNKLCDKPDDLCVFWIASGIDLAKGVAKVCVGHKEKTCISDLERAPKSSIEITIADNLPKIVLTDQSFYQDGQPKPPFDKDPCFLFEAKQPGTNAISCVTFDTRRKNCRYKGHTLQAVNIKINQEWSCQCNGFVAKKGILTLSAEEEEGEPSP